MATQPFLSFVSLLVLDCMHLLKMVCEAIGLFVFRTSQRCVFGDWESATISRFFRGKTVLITGASSGLGEAMTLELARLSATGDIDINIIISSRSVEKLEVVAEKCNALSSKTRVTVIPLDLANLSEEAGGGLDKYMTTLHSKLKELSLNGIDCLIGNAGMSSRGKALDTTEEVLQGIMKVNFFGPVALTKAIAKDMCKRSAGGSIAVVSSVQGKLGLPYRTSYASSKHALQGYFDSLRGELSLSGIGVTVISPGYINTNLSINAITENGEKYGVTDATTKSGMSPKCAARMSLLAIAQETPDYVLADAKTVAAIQGKVQFPKLLAKFMNKRAKNAIS
mmetsp:Transcript_11557/g.18867  ORF Transcript_11557/g.18867 Transcript_11557/m.18867 type:complete len:338 (-) Transcript_11557:21-1034(-)